MSPPLRPLYLVLSLASLGAAACGGASDAKTLNAPSTDTTAPMTPLAPPPSTQARPRYPATPKRPETFRVGAFSLQDDYAWLRDADAPETLAWMRAQNDFTTARLQTYPHLDALRARFRDITGSARSALTEIEGSHAGFFAMRREPSQPQPALVLVGSLDHPDQARVVLDPAVLDPSGQTTIDWFAAARSGERVAVSLSKDGTEDGSLWVLDVRTGKFIAGPIPRVQYPTGGGSAAFSTDGNTLFYTQYPAPGERADGEIHLHQRVQQRALGTANPHDATVPLELPALAAVHLRRAGRDGTIVVQVDVGDAGEQMWFVGRPSAKDGYAWSKLADVAEDVVGLELARDALFVLTRKSDLRGEIVRVPLKSGVTPRLADGRVLVPASDRELTAISVAGDTLVAFDIMRGNTRARAFDLSGKARGEVKLPERSTVTPAAIDDAGALYVEVESFTAPRSVQKLDAHALALHPTAVASTDIDFSDVEAAEETATSRDGTQVPITLLSVRGTPRSPETPLLLTGYGGYGIGQNPQFRSNRRVWLDQGGIIAIAHLRGGNENGEAWHRNGRLERKQNVFDDFIACAEHLVRAGYTSKPKLALSGRSNGGLLMGAVLTQRPDLARAVVITAAVLDMPRYAIWPNGRLQAGELGSVLNPELAPKVLAYSPYQNVKPAAYPAVFLLSGIHDGRVDPADTRAFAAKLQELSSSSEPILLRQWFDSGHGQGANVFKRAEEDAQVHAFLFQELEIPYRSGRNLSAK